MSVDLRGFEYGAEPVLQRRQWQLDAAAAELGKAVQAVTAGQSRLAALREQLAMQAEASSAPLSGRMDPAAHSRALLWLASLQARIEQARDELRGLEARRDDVLQQLRVVQGQVDALETHREDAKQEFGAQAAAHAATEADRDWLARRSSQVSMRRTS